MVLTNIKSKGNTDLNLDFETQNKYPFLNFDLKSKFKLESPIDLDFETQTKYKWWTKQGNDTMQGINSRCSKTLEFKQKERNDERIWYYNVINPSDDSVQTLGPFQKSKVGKRNITYSLEYLEIKTRKPIQFNFESFEIMAFVNAKKAWMLLIHGTTWKHQSWNGSIL